MNEVNPVANATSPVSSVAGQNITDSSAVKATDSNNAPEYVTKEEYAALLKRLDSQSGMLAGIQKRLEKVGTETKPPAESTKQLSLDERVSTLEAERKALEENKKRQKDIKALMAIESSLSTNGVDAKQAKRFAKLIHLENGSNIAVDDSFETVVYREAEDKETPLESWVAAYLQTDEGRTMLPIKRNPSSMGLSGNLSSNAGSVRKVTEADLANGLVDPKEILSGKVVVVS